MCFKSFLSGLWRGLKSHFVEIIVVLTALTMLAGLALIASSIIKVATDVKTIHKKAETAENEAREAKAVQRTLLENSELNKRQWSLLEEHNPEIAVPQVVEDQPNTTPIPNSEKIIVTEKKPRPTPTPRIEIVKRTKIKRVIVRTPTPKPFWEYFRKDSQRDPNRTR